MAVSRPGAIRLLAIAAVVGTARPAFADGVFNYDPGRVVIGLVCLALVILAPILLLVVWLMRTSGRKTVAPTPRRWPDDPPPELPVARTVVDSRRAE